VTLVNIRDKPAPPTVAKARDPADPSAAPRVPTNRIARAFDPAEPGVAPAPTEQIGRPLPTRLWLAGGGFALSPLNRRRWRNFKANRRGYWSLWIFLALFVLSLFAEVIANDKPIIARYKGEFLFPALVDYPESKFGGFLAVTDYKDPVILDEMQEHGWAIWPPISYSYRSINKDYPRVKNPAGQCLGFPGPPPWSTGADLCDAPAAQLARYSSIGNRNWLGTDDQGRDVLARLIYGFRISVLFGLILTAISSIIGVAAGAVQGYFGGWTDLLFQRFIEIWTSVPSLYLLLIISSVLVPGFFVLLGILLLFSWVSLVGLVRAEFLRGRNFEYIQAARALGVSNLVIMFRHLLPNAMVATLTFLPFILSSSVMTLTALDFLGFGLPPGSPSLGELLSQGKANVQAPWLGLAGFFSLAIMLSLLIFIGEAVRDAFDARKTFA
jgi:microcin C transport system permease protein